MPRRASLVRAAGLAALLATLVAVTWPRSADPALARAYDRLGQTSVPVLVAYTPSFDPTTVSLEPDGYTSSVGDAEVAPLIVRGSRDRAAPPPAQPGETVLIRGTTADVQRDEQPGGPVAKVSWRESDATYTLSVPGGSSRAALERVAQRVVTAEDARRAALGDQVDTPLLYLFYLPLGVGFAVWSAIALLRDVRVRAETRRAAA